MKTHAKAVGVEGSDKVWDKEVASCIINDIGSTMGSQF